MVGTAAHTARHTAGTVRNVVGTAGVAAAAAAAVTIAQRHDVCAATRQLHSLLSSLLLLQRTRLAKQRRLVEQFSRAIFL